MWLSTMIQRADCLDGIKTLLYVRKRIMRTTLFVFAITDSCKEVSSLITQGDCVIAASSKKTLYSVLLNYYSCIFFQYMQTRL